MVAPHVPERPKRRARHPALKISALFELTDGDENQHHHRDGCKNCKFKSFLPDHGSAFLLSGDENVKTDERQDRTEGIKRVTDAKQSAALVVVLRKLSAQREMWDEEHG